MSSTSESSNAYDGLDPSDMSPDDILNILAKFLGSPDHLIQSPDSSSSDSISDIELARSRHSSTYTAETVYHPSESSYVDYTTMGDATHEEESHASEGSVMPSYRGTVSATHTEDDMVQYLDSTEQTRIKDVQGSELALLYQSPTTPINAGNYSIYDAHFQCQQQQQIDHVLGEHAPVLREDPPVNTAPALPVVAAAEQDVQMGAPGFSYPLVIHIPEYIPGVDGPPPEHLSTRKKRKALNAPESLCSRNAPKKQRSLQYIPAVDAQGSHGGGTCDAASLAPTTRPTPEPRYGACEPCRLAKRKCVRIGDVCEQCVSARRTALCIFEAIRPGGRPRKNAQETCERRGREDCETGALLSD